MPDALTAIAAVARNGVIGRDGGLPWHIPEDMRHFKQTTMGGALVMGRATYLSFGAKPLPGRALFVVSRSASVILPQAGSHAYKGSFEAGSITWCPSIGEALSAARASGRPVFVAGGEAIYRAAWPLLTDLDLTLVDAEPAGDRFFPAIDEQEWQETSREPHDGFSFVRYRRRP